MKLRNSLLSKYLLIILVAIMIMPMSFPIISIIVFMPMQEFDKNISSDYESGTDLEKMWHKEAKKLDKASDFEITKRLEKVKRKYEKSQIFWVDSNGKVKLKLPEDQSIPMKWTPSYTVEFMKKSYGLETDPFTVVAFIGGKEEQGFIVFQYPRFELQSPNQKLSEEYDYIIIIATFVILALFIFISWIFFYKIRKRLLRLQKAMSYPADDGIPMPLKVGKIDEIGQLEQSFNHMIEQLQESRKREREEEELRKSLVANLSHDLRTPLTTIRGHAYQLQKEPLSDQGKESLQLIDTKIGFLGELIENLLSYSQLSAGKYPYHPKDIDVVRLVRTSIANWYPVFENAGFEIEVDVPEFRIERQIDPLWLERILDNFYQNITRHAKPGKYIGVKMEQANQGFCLTIEDKGQGMRSETLEKGTGIGLSIVSLMMKEMKLEWEIKSDHNGTKIFMWL